MFGQHDLHKHGVPARSVVISVVEGVQTTVGHSTHDHVVDRSEVPQEGPGRLVYYDVVARVEFGDGTTGQHADRLWRHDVGCCLAGDVLPVRYAADDRSKMVFDVAELRAGRLYPKENIGVQRGRSSPGRSGGRS